MLNIILCPIQNVRFSSLANKYSFK
jgi:hypothetical protein